MDREKRLKLYKDGKRTPEEQAAYQNGYQEGIRRVAVIVDQFFYQACREHGKWPSKRLLKSALERKVRSK